MDLSQDELDKKDPKSGLDKEFTSGPFHISNCFDAEFPTLTAQDIAQCLDVKGKELMADKKNAHTVTKSVSGIDTTAYFNYHEKDGSKV